MRRRTERGLAASVEAALVLPVLALFIGLLITLGRVAVAEQQVGAAASAGARAASLERSTTRARAAAGDAVSAALSQRGLTCADHRVDVDASAVARALGQEGRVWVRVTCRVNLADVGLPFLPGSVTVDGERRSPVDPLRGR